MSLALSTIVLLAIVASCFVSAHISPIVSSNVTVIDTKVPRVIVRLHGNLDLRDHHDQLRLRRNTHNCNVTGKDTSDDDNTKNTFEIFMVYSGNRTESGHSATFYSNATKRRSGKYIVCYYSWSLNRWFIISGKNVSISGIPQVFTLGSLSNPRTTYSVSSTVGHRLRLMLNGTALDDVADRLYAVRGLKINCQRVKSFDLTFDSVRSKRACDGACRSTLWTAPAPTIEGQYVLCYRSSVGQIITVPGNLTINARLGAMTITQEAIAGTSFVVSAVVVGAGSGARTKLLLERSGDGVGIPVSCATTSMVSRCAPGTSRVENACLMPSRGTGNIDVAATWCTNRGMTLATLDNTETLNRVGRVYRSYTSALWVGLRYSYGRWAWSDGTPVSASILGSSPDITKCWTFKPSDGTFAQADCATTLIEGLCSIPIGLMGTPLSQRNANATFRALYSGYYRVCVRPSTWAPWTLLSGTVVVHPRILSSNVTWRLLGTNLRVMVRGFGLDPSHGDSVRLRRFASNCDAFNKEGPDVLRNGESNIVEVPIGSR
eukprot:PhF_6_TR6066/c0_g1_i3/m.8800